MTIYQDFAMFCHEYFADFDQVFGAYDESGTYKDQKSYNFDPKLNKTLTLRKVQILYRIGKIIFSH